MPAKIISGTEVAKQIREELAKEVAALKEKHNVVPGLVTILVGENPASVSYVTGKQKTAKELGFYSLQDNQPADIPESKLLELIERYNRDPRIHGILVQLPLPKHVNETKVLYAIDPRKDVDAFHPVNVGKLLIGEADYLPCTPAGIQQLLIRSGVKTDGAEVVVLGRSNIVGKPIANMLMQKGPGANATVTVVHTATRDLAAHCQRADILIVAAGVPGLVKPEWIKPGACVIDVGVNRVGETTSATTGRTVAILRGDVDFEEAAKIAGCITPVPGGVGPMTIAMLMRNTLNSLKFRLQDARTGI